MKRVEDVPAFRSTANFTPDPPIAGRTTAGALVSAIPAFEELFDVKTAAHFLGVSPSLVYAYVERKQIPHYRMMGRAIRFSLAELAKWRRLFYVNGGIDE